MRWMSDGKACCNCVVKPRITQSQDTIGADCRVALGSIDEFEANHLKYLKQS